MRMKTKEVHDMKNNCVNDIKAKARGHKFVRSFLLLFLLLAGGVMNGAWAAA